jgi:hypothetical protein
MNDWKYKFLVQLFSGILLALILGIAGLLVGMSIGGNYGCLSIINSMFGTRGYESCGAFGGVLGMFLGSFFGVWLMSRVKISNYFRMFIILLAILLVPLTLYSISILSSEYSVGFVGFLWGLLKFLSILMGLSLLMIICFNWRETVKGFKYFIKH